MDGFIGLLLRAVDFFEDDLRLGDRELVIFAAHRLDEDGEVKLAAAANAGCVVAEVFLDF